MGGVGSGEGTDGETFYQAPGRREANRDALDLLDLFRSGNLISYVYKPILYNKLKNTKKTFGAR
jgi:hypothetical protein